MTTLQKTSNLVLGDSKKSLSSAPPTVTKNPIAATSQSLESHVKEIQKLTSNSNLSITPVTSAPQKSVNTNQVDSVVKPRNVNKSDITINKIENSDINQSKSTNKPPLPAEIIKTSNSLTIIPTSTMTIKTSSSERMKRIDFVEPKKDEVPEDLHGKHNENHNSTKEAHKSKEHSKSEKPDSNHCQIIDLTDTLTAELKKEKKSLHHKNRTKLFEGPEKGLIRVKTDLMKVKSDKDEMNTKICENLNELMQQNMSTKASTSTSSASIGSHGKSKDSANQYSPFSTTPPLDYQMMKSSNEGDDIHKAMENLKALQRLSSPAKSNEALTSSPVSVIAYNKSYSPKGVLHNAGSLPQAPPNVPLRGDYKGDFGSGFQEVFQRQFLNEFTMMQNSVNHSASTSSKGHFNRLHIVVLYFCNIFNLLCFVALISTRIPLMFS